MGARGEATELAGPAPGHPPRRPGSVRRTTSLDLRPAPDGTIALHGRARDLLTPAAGGAPTVVATALVRLTVGPDLRVTAATAHPSDVSVLVGRPALAGFRTAVWRGLRADYDAGSPLHQLLDDVPGGMVIGGFTARRVHPSGSDDALPPARRRIDVCVGWASGSDAVERLRRDGVPPPPDWCPPAADPSAQDPMGGHTLAPLPRWGMRRARRIDVRREAEGLAADVGFRDTFVDGDGLERVLHEYTAEVGVDGAGVLARCDPVPRVLPHRECPLAAASARTAVGRPVEGLRESVSLDFFGPSTCTHLNDLLRGLADLPRLAAVLAGG